MKAPEVLTRIMNFFAPEPPAPAINARNGAGSGMGRYRTIGGFSYDGEKNAGELGPIKSYLPDYGVLRQRSWDVFLDSLVCQIVIKKYTSWTIGKGLKLQSEPETLVLEDEGININKEKWTRLLEARFRLFKRSRRADYSNMSSLNILESEAFKNAKVGGDVLVILRYIKGEIKVQLIDGAHVVSPNNFTGNERFPHILDNGNRILHGIEIAPNGEHVAFHVVKPSINSYNFRTERIPARGRKNGMLMAFMVYGSKYRLDSVRGLPLLSVILETAKKMERYHDATLGSAEERQKIAYTIEHQAFSTGENPIANQTVIARNTLLNNPNGELPKDSLGDELADKIAASTMKQTFNLPLGAAMKEVTSKNELYFKDFIEKNIDITCAGVEIPPNVAMSKYDANFSASRAALKDWDNTLNIQREYFSQQFLQPIFEFFFFIQVHLRKIKAPGYINAMERNDFMLLEAYYKTRFVGVPVPHIDPVKEVEAERLKLGDAALAIPLTTVEQSTEKLGEGDSETNLEQFAIELKNSKALGVKVDVPPAAGVKTVKKPAKKKN